MQWKRAAVFAATDSARPDFLSWLQSLPGGLDTVKVQSWQPVPPQQPNLYVLFGWSTSGADELRRATIDSVVATNKQVDVYVSRPLVEAQGGLMGTADMKFVGWEINLDDHLPAGHYTGRMLVRRDTIKVSTKPGFSEAKVAGRGYCEAAHLDFDIQPAKQK